MVQAKREYEGGLVAWHACAVIAFLPFTGKTLNPGEVNPYRASDGGSEELEAARRQVTQDMFAAMIREAFKEAGKEV